MAKFEQRHYEAIAKVIATFNLELYTAKKLADMFVVDNPRFKYFKFIEACGFENDWCDERNEANSW